MDHDDMPRLEPAGRVKEKIREVTAEWTCEPRVPDEPPPLIPVRVRPVVVQWDESARRTAVRETKSSRCSLKRNRRYAVR